MKIKKIETIPLQFELEKPIWDAQHFIPSRQALIVKVTTDDGIVGYGEAASFGGPMESTKTVIDKEISSFFIGEDPFDTERLWEKVYYTTMQHGRKGIVISALSGIDVALWDIKGKALQKPVYKILGSYRDVVDAYASSGFYREDKDITRLCAEMEKHISDGYKMVKMKVGGLKPKEDLKRITEVRKTIGEDIEFAIDANSNWDVPTAKWMSKKVEDLSIKWIEEPVSPDNVSGSLEVAKHTTIPIAGYEQEFTKFGYKQLIDKKAVHIVQPDVIWSGGITECRKIAAIAESSHLPIIPHVFSSGVCLAANIHFIASIPNGSLLEMDQNINPLRHDLIKGALMPDKDGRVFLPDTPGLGVEIDVSILEKYRID